MKQKYSYRLACKFENAPSTETEMTNQQTAVQEGWKQAGKPAVTSVKVLRAPEGSFSFATHHNIKG